ncbi:HGGxSTG domain-containing protein [Methylobacterium sp. BE186]|uniref:HGGxSTG domain-containing protein n=1 Tax=Methylobacterium sp. BE186 TaxID=2817715 RepID=UPI0038621399
MISPNEPHAPNGCARLQGAFAAARCGAKRRDGGSCLQPAMPNGRCRMHGGKSTGPRTEAGLARSRRSTWQHGHYSTEARAERREARLVRRAAIQLLLDLKAMALLR